MVNKIKKAWKWANGRKRKMALIYWSILTPCLLIAWPAGMPILIFKIHAIIGTILSGIGYGHAWAKTIQNKRSK